MFKTQRSLKIWPEKIEASDASAVLVDAVWRSDVFGFERNDAQNLVVVPQRTSHVPPDSEKK
jgi:hypothetical protein